MICRLCLKTLQRKEAIFIFEECESKWLKLIMKYFDLVLTADDSISTMICNDCSMHLEEFHKFWLYVDEKQATLHNEFIKIEQCSDNEVILDLAEFETLVEREVEPCDGIVQIAHEEFFNATNMEGEGPPTDDDIPLLQLRNKSKRSTISTETKMNRTLQLSKEEVLKNSNEIIFNEPDKLLEHITLNQNPEALKCDICNIQLHTEESLKLHKKTTHSRNESSVCHICNKKFRNERCFKDHLQWHKNKTATTCNICGKIFTLKNNMRRHIASIHHNIYPYVCEICGNKFRFEPEYLRHLQESKCIGEEPVQCDVCGEWMKNKEFLRSHMPKHNGNNVTCPQLYSCPHCSKQYRTKSNVYRHLKLFHGEVWSKSKLARYKNQIFPKMQ